MLDVSALRGRLAHAASSARIVIRCLAGGRDLQDCSQRAIMLLVDTLDSIHRLREQTFEIEQDNHNMQPDKWTTTTTGNGTGGNAELSRLDALSSVLECFSATMRSMEMFFQPVGVGVSFYRRRVLERTFLGRLEQFKGWFLLAGQSGSSKRSFLDCEIRNSLLALREVQSVPKVDPQLEERVLGVASQLASEHLMTLADLCNRRLPGSGQWIVEDEEYKQWLLGYTKTLYCVGPPGVGKTFISASIIDSLQRTFTSADVATVFVFCQDETSKEQTTLDLLQNILAQLVYRNRSLSYASSSLHESEVLMNGKASPRVYQNAIRAEVDRFSKVFFVIDGLDVLSDKERFLSRLQKLPDQVQLLVTLREVAQVEELSSYVTVLTPPFDLQAYAVSRIENDPGLSALLKRDSSPHVYANALNMVTERSHGVFLLATIHLDLLTRYAHKNSKKSFERSLVHLPHTLTEAYGEAMKEVVSHSSKATAYVYWTLYSLRPLSVAELKYAVNKDDSEANDETVNFEHSLHTQSAGILTVDAVSGTVRFIHRTAKEYLTGAPARVFFPAAQKDIAESCLTAITPDEVVDDCYYNGGTASRTSGSGFLSYAARYWGYHAREVSEDEQTIQVLIKTFLNKLLWRRPPLQVLTNQPRIPTELGLGKYPQDWTALHVLAYFGIVSKSRRLFVQGASLDANDNSFRITPLHCAASQGNIEVAEFLLDNGADGNTVARDGCTALHLAAQYGQRQIMKLLLHQPVNPQVANEEGATALQVAVRTEWDEATVPLLVKNKVDVNTRNIRTGDTALHLAIRWKRSRIVLHLLEKGASIDMTNEDGFTPLQLAVKVDNCEAISTLLQRRANIEARSLSGLTALQLAAQERHWVAFDLLILGGADINAWNKDGESLIHEQARHATSPSIASKLLTQGAEIEAFTAKGLTPLHCAAIAANKTMFTFLLSHGAKPDTLTANSESLLHLTPPISEDGLAILKSAAVDYGLDVDAPSSRGWMPLHQAVYVGTGAPDHTFPKISEYIHLLLAQNANVNARLQPSTLNFSSSTTNTPTNIPAPIVTTTTNNAETPLHLAITAIVPRPSLIDLLISSGADVNLPTAEGKTPLHLAAERGRESIFRTLYEAGADVSLEAPDSAKADDGLGGGNRNTALEVALRNPFGREWFGVDGCLKPPSAERERRDSVGTVIDEEDLGGDEVKSGFGDGFGDEEVKSGFSTDDEEEDEEDVDSDEEQEDAEVKNDAVVLELRGEKPLPVSLGRNETPYVIV